MIFLYYCVNLCNHSENHPSKYKGQLANNARLTDEEIVHAIITQRKTKLFGILYDRYANKVYRKCISFVQDKDSAQDMVQDVFLKVFMKLGKFEGRSRFSTWLYAITYNYCVEYYRKAKKLSTVDINEKIDLGEEEDFTENEILSLRTEQLKYALNKIAPEDKMILLMKYQDDMPIKEIMHVLELSESAAKMRLRRARQRVKVIIQQAEKVLD